MPSFRLRHSRPIGSCAPEKARHALCLLDDQQNLTAIDLIALADMNLLHRAVCRCCERLLHLHGLNNEERSALLDFRPRLDQKRKNRPGHGRLQST